MKLSYHLQEQQKEYNKVKAKLKRIQDKEDLENRLIKRKGKGKKKLTGGRALVIGVVSAVMTMVTLITFSPTAGELPIGEYRVIILFINIAILYILYITGRK